MEDLKVALVQSELVWEKPEQNRINFSNKINAIKEKVDLIVLPEMFTTGFTMNPVNVAETMDGETIQWLQKVAHENECAIMGSIIIKEQESYFNRLVFVHPSMKVGVYDKRHTFTLAGEHDVYTAGTEKQIFDYKGWKICPMICYDLRFPVWARNVEGYDLLVYVANWPKPRVNAWDALLKARAIENMSYCIGVNRVGTDANDLEYNGHSAAYDSLGNMLSTSIPTKEETLIVSLKSNHLTETRNKLQFLKDSDDFTLSF